MHFKRFLFALLVGCACLFAQAQNLKSSDAVATTLAPSGELKVGVYLGSPTSLVIDARSGQTVGVAVELGRALAHAIERPVRLVTFERVAQVIEALKSGQVDMTFTNATAARAKEVDFTVPLIRLELGVLIANNATAQTFGDIDRQGFRLGVSKGSSSQSALGSKLKAATLIAVDSLEQAQKSLQAGELDGFATNKGILFELNERLVGFKVMDDRWGLENLAIAIPKGRDLAAPFLAEFAKQQQDSGAIEAIAKRAGLRGTAKD